jgi:hypothetical protein
MIRVVDLICWGFSDGQKNSWRSLRGNFGKNLFRNLGWNNAVASRFTVDDPHWA